MTIVRLEHTVSSFEDWKRAFDSDPVGRREKGVRRYRIMRDTADEDHVMIDLEFDAREQAEEFLAAVREVWARVDVVREPKGRIVEVVESEELATAGQG